MKIPYTHHEDPELAIVLGVGKEHGIDEAMITYTSKIDVKDWVLLKCKYGCGNYGKSYSCPPNSIPTEEMRKIMREYKRAIFVVSKTKSPEDQKKFKKILLDMEKELIKNEFYKAFALVPCACDRCEICGTIEGRPCSNKDNRPCIEGTGIDIFSLAKKHKKNIQTLKQMKEASESYGLILLD
ncbi:DUF2284 domain-containing protein [Candidatus Woesearchaeota archaeon]|nr:DUF2284 domain-containing protein [Candidatus Woesearchaeota archaeon]